MSEEQKDTNGWGAYKLAVLQQLEFLTAQVAAVQAAVNKIDKDMGMLVTRDKMTSEIISTNVRIDELVIWKATVEGKSARANIISIIAVLVAISTTIVHLLISGGKP